MSAPIYFEQRLSRIGLLLIPPEAVAWAAIAEQNGYRVCGAGDYAEHCFSTPLVPYRRLAR